jgi:DNA-binding beta-propeller fold protein YncE
VSLSATAALAVTPTGAVRTSYLHQLSDFTGPIRLDVVEVAVDDVRQETYVCDRANRSIRVFNDAGMETYRFGDDDRIGAIYDVAVLKNGDLLLLCYREAATAFELVRCDYRGEPIGRLSVSGLPRDLGEFGPTRMFRREQKLYLADLNAMKVAVTDLEGQFQAGFDLGSLIGMDPQKVANSGMRGFCVDAQGNLYFTVPVDFRVYRLAPDGGLASFGQAGSAPGKFGVIDGVTVDQDGTIYVADTLKSTVSVFNREFRFQVEFGYRNEGPGGLLGPKNLAVSSDGRLFVSQQGRRGVSVFRVVRD